MPNNTDPARDNTREEAINEAARRLSRLSSRGGRKKLLETLFDAGTVYGAASIDRVQFDSVEDRASWSVEFAKGRVKRVNRYITECGLPEDVEEFKAFLHDFSAAEVPHILESERAEIERKAVEDAIKREVSKLEIVGRWTRIEDTKPEIGRRVLFQSNSGEHYMAKVSNHHHYHFSGDKYNFEINEVFAWAYINPCSTAF